MTYSTSSSQLLGGSHEKLLFVFLCAGARDKEQQITVTLGLLFPLKSVHINIPIWMPFLLKIVFNNELFSKQIVQDRAAGRELLLLPLSFFFFLTIFS